MKLSTAQMQWLAANGIEVELGSLGATFRKGRWELVEHKNNAQWGLWDTQATVWAEEMISTDREIPWACQSLERTFPSLREALKFLSEK